MSKSLIDVATIVAMAFLVVAVWHGRGHRGVNKKRRRTSDRPASIATTTAAAEEEEYLAADCEEEPSPKNTPLSFTSKAEKSV